MSEGNSQPTVLEQIRNKFKPGEQLTARDLEIPVGMSLHGLQNALWVLSKKGFLDKPRGAGTKGVYILRGRKAPAKSAPAKITKKRANTDPTDVVIENLLTAMAAAEPVLRKWSAIREVLKGI